MGSILTDSAPVTLKAGTLSLNTATRVLSGPTGSTALNAASYLILRDLMRHPGHILSAAQMIEAAWLDADAEPGNPEQAFRARISRAKDDIESVGGSRDQLACRFQQGYFVRAGQAVVRTFTPSQDALFRQLLETHPDRAAAMQLAPC